MAKDPSSLVGRRFLTPPDEDSGVVLLSDEQQEDRLEARTQRASIIEKYGFVPRSILTELANYHDEVLDAYVDDQFGRAFQNAFSDTRKQRRKAYAQELKVLQTAIGDDIDLSKFVSRHHRGNGLSQFGARVVVFCLRMYSEEGETVFDPFVGRLTTLLVAHKLHRHAVGYDLSKPFARWNTARLERLKLAEAEQLFCEERDYTIEYFNADSRKLHLADNTVDYIVTSPPYWHQEFYGQEEGQLGWLGSYQDFLEGLLEVLKECYRVLKPGKFCTFAVQNMRDSDGSYVHYTADLSILMRRAGLTMWDEAIYQRGLLTAAVVSKNEAARHTAKVHESLITARKMR